MGQRTVIGVSLTEPDDHHCSRKPTKCGTIFNSEGKRRDKENNEAEDIDDREQNNSFVSAEVLIGDDGTDDWSYVAPKLEKVL